MEPDSRRQPHCHSERPTTARAASWRDALKLAAEEEERFGVVLWNGGMATEPRGCWPATTSLLLERAEGAASLADMARNGRDDEACQVLPLTRRHGIEYNCGSDALIDNI
jgi:streptomycin 6-kinase